MKVVIYYSDITDGKYKSGRKQKGQGHFQGFNEQNCNLLFYLNFIDKFKVEGHQLKFGVT